jgi:hypothetical protein
MKRYISAVIIFLLGMIVPIGIGLFQVHKNPERPLTKPRVFGDIRIVPAKLPFNSKVRLLEMQKDKITFAIIMQDPNGKTMDITLMDNKGAAILDLRPRPKRWLASYGNNSSKEKTCDTLLLDLNFDGRFDAKYYYDKEGGIEDRYIFFQTDWIPVEQANYSWAKVDSNYYCFDQNDGWQSADANIIEKSEK